MSSQLWVDGLKYRLEFSLLSDLSHPRHVERRRGLRFSEFRDVYGRAAIRYPRLTCYAVLSVDGTIFKNSAALWRTSGLCMTIRIVSQDSSNEVHERDQEAAHTSYKTDTESSNSLRRGSPPHGQDVWHATICMGERQGRRQETLIRFHVHPIDPIIVPVSRTLTSTTRFYCRWRHNYVSKSNVRCSNLAPAAGHVRGPYG